MWAFHLILVTWFLDVFGKEVANILRNSLFTFFYWGKARQAKQKFKVKKIMQKKWRKKNKVTKIFDEPGND